MQKDPLDEVVVRYEGALQTIVLNNAALRAFVENRSPVSQGR